MSCYVVTGSRVDHPTWACCDEHPKMVAAMREAEARGNRQESCLIAPMPDGDAVLAAHAFDDLTFLLGLLDGDAS